MVTNNRNFDVMPDGEQFVIVVPEADDETEGEQAPPPQIIIVQNCYENMV